MTNSGGPYKLGLQRADGNKGAKTRAKRENLSALMIGNDTNFAMVLPFIVIR